MVFGGRLGIGRRTSTSSGPAPVRGDRAIPERISVWLVVLIVLGLLAHGYNMTQIDQDSDLAVKSHFFLIIMVVGLVVRGAMAAVFNYKLVPDMRPNAYKLALYMVFAGILIMSSGAIWSMTAPEAPGFLAGATVTQVKLFYTFGAVAEEIFWIWGIFLPLCVVFGIFSVSLFGRKLPFPPWTLALLTVCILFAVFHRAVYETAPQLWLMFVYRAVFTLSYILSAWWGGTRDITIAVLAHMTVNYLASG